MFHKRGKLRVFLAQESAERFAIARVEGILCIDLQQAYRIGAVGVVRVQDSLGQLEKDLIAIGEADGELGRPDGFGPLLSVELAEDLARKAPPS